MINAFTAGAEEANNQVFKFDLQKMNIHPCLGCFGGGKDEKSPCVQKDDMDQIYQVFKEADIVVLASPLYYWTISGQLKCAIDRLFAVAESDAEYRNPRKDCILLMAAEGYGFEDVISYYDSLMKHLSWNDLGKILVGGVMQVGDIVGKPQLAEAKELGKSL